MTYRGRIAVEMLRRVGIALALVAAYLAVAGVIALGLWWGFGLTPPDLVGVSLLTPILLIAIGFIGFILYESSKDKVDTLDRTIMRALGQTPGYRDDK